MNPRGLSAGVVISTALAACTADNSGPVHPPQIFSRESVCFYMASNDASRLSGTPASLDDIVTEFRRLNSNRIVISNRIQYSDYIQGYNSEALIPELLHRGLARSQIFNIASPVSETYLWSIGICPEQNLRDIEDTGPPTQASGIQFRVGTANLTIPIQHLYYTYWRDIPMGRLERTNDVEMRFRWLNHSLQSEVPSTACYRRRDDECGEILTISIRSYRGGQPPIDVSPYLMDTWHTPDYFVSCAQLRLRIPAHTAVPHTARCSLLLAKPPHLRVSYNVPDIFFAERHLLANVVARQVLEYLE